MRGVQSDSLRPKHEVKETENLKTVSTWSSSSHSVLLSMANRWFAQISSLMSRLAQIAACFTDVTSLTGYKLNSAFNL